MRAESRKRRRTMLAGGLVVILGAFGYLVYSGIGNNLVYFLTPSELVAKGPGVYGKPVRLGGQVKPGTVEWNKDTMQLDFKITDGLKTLEVHATGTPPAMFRPGIGVVVEGHIDKAGVFVTNHLMVKHSNEYHPPAPGQKPEEMYKTLIKEGNG